MTRIKYVESPSYNYLFNAENGFFVRWGATKDDDPDFSPYGPEILDIEVSTVCHGIGGKPCAHCYKSNTGRGKNISFATFKEILDKMPRNLTQVAFGIGDLDGNPDLFQMMEYCRTNGRNPVVPNITINGWNLTDALAKRLVELCGAVSVSRYRPKDVCYDAVKKLTDLGLRQVNIHQLVAKETYEDCLELLDDFATDARLAKLNAIVLLSLKPKGKRNTFHAMSPEHFKHLVTVALERGVPLGFDSCTAHKFMEVVKDHPDRDAFEMVAESCESTLFSSYVNVDGDFFPCSFAEGCDGIDPISVTECGDFLKGVWYHPRTIEFRNALIASGRNELKCRRCVLYAV